MCWILTVCGTARTVTQDKTHGVYGSAFSRESFKRCASSFNRAMSEVRITVEWIFKEMKINVTVVD